MTLALTISNLFVRVGDHLALEDLNFQVPESAYFAVVGPNGAGKSILMKTLLGTIKPQSGTIQVFGQTPDQMRTEWIGYVPQFKTLDRTFPALSIELVMTGILSRWPAFIGKKDRETAMAALKTVRAEKLWDRSLDKLSGGELQRVYLARALVRKPRLVILDEPATGIDVVGEEDMQHLLEIYRAETKATIIMVTHDLDVARHHATHVLLLNQKQISFGTPAECLTESGVLRTFGHATHSHHGGHSHG